MGGLRCDAGRQVMRDTDPPTRPCGTWERRQGGREAGACVPPPDEAQHGLRAFVSAYQYACAGLRGV